MKFFIALTLFSLSSNFVLAMEEPVCEKCEVIREYNKTHHKNYEYYEDYLKEQKNTEKTAEEL